MNITLTRKKTFLVAALITLNLGTIFSESKHKKNPEFSTVGLTNSTGYWCYRNTATQVLTHLDLDLSEKNRNPAQGELKKFKSQLNSTTSSAINPTQFYSGFGRYAAENSQLFSSHNQEDSGEFFEAMYSVLCKNDQDLVAKLGCKQISTVECQSCKKCTTAIDPQISPILFLRARSEQKKSLTTILEATFAPSKLNDYRCDLCKKRGSCIMMQHIVEPSKYLILQLPRFTECGSKETSQIKIPQDINIKPYLLYPIRFATYTLCAVICHNGSTKGGHYWAYIKNKADNSWWNFNDAQVSKVENISEKLNSQAPFILFYEFNPEFGFFAWLKSLFV